MDTTRYSPDLLSAAKDKTYYALTMFASPSGPGLHCGHASIFTINDVVARYKRMQGYTVLNPFGFDAFGLPTENYAIKQGKPAREVTDASKQHFLNQVGMLNMSFDMSRIIDTSEPEYYKWTQWLFSKLYEAGLAYKDTLWVNRCPVDQTVLANDQVVDGKCERCKSEITQKKHPQRFIKITDYADRLIADLDTIDRPEETKTAQKNWIGRSEGAEIDFKVAESATTITCFTTRPDTIYGVTAIVIAPESTMLDELMKKESMNLVEEYRQTTLAKTSVQRQKDLKEKTGVNSGLFAIHPLTKKEIPIRYADYVLAGYGSGAVMSVPAHDARDKEFAEKFGLEVVQVVTNDAAEDESELVREGTLINSGEFDGLTHEEGQEKITAHLEALGVGRKKVTYKLRDRSVSRQRYWGSPVPIWYDEVGNEHLVPESELPVVLPLDLEDYKPTGKSPLEDHPTFPRYCPQPLESKSSPPTPLLQRGEHVLGADVRDHIYEGVDGGLVEFTKELRKRETSAEKVIREFLRDKRFLGLKWRRQHPVAGYIADFFCHELQLIIEVDGSVHDTEDQKRKDKWKEQDLLVEGLTIVRITNSEVFESEDIIEALIELVTPSLKERGLGGEDQDGSKTNSSEEDGQGGGFSGGKQIGTRECDTLDTFMCSSFYYLRFPDAGNPDELIRKELAQKLLPVDFYSGGKEHTVGHLLYARFIHKFLFDQGYVESPEPFKKLIHQGMVLGADGRKMGKRYGNGIDPTDVVKQYSADALRAYLMFMGPIEADKPWSDTSLNGVAKFLNRVDALLTIDWKGTQDDAVESMIHQTIGGMTYDIDNLKLNTCISKLMILVNTMYEKKAVTNDQLMILAQLLAPFATDIAEKIRTELGGEGDVHFSSWPIADESKILASAITLPIQINGKVRAKIDIDAGLTEDEVVELAKANDTIPKWLEDKKIVKVIRIQDKILNLIVK